MSTLTQTQAAAIRGITTRRLRQREAEGSGPPRNADGSYDVTEFSKWLHSELVAEGDAGDSYSAQQCRLLHHRADLAELSLTALRSQLVRTELVEEKWQELRAHIRAKVFELRSRLLESLAEFDLAPGWENSVSMLLEEAVSELDVRAIPNDVESHQNVE